MGAASSPCWSPQLLPAAACPCVTCPAANACRPPQLAARGLHSWPMHPAAAAPSCCVCSLPMPPPLLCRRGSRCSTPAGEAAAAAPTPPPLLPSPHRCSLCRPRHRSSRARAAAPCAGCPATPSAPRLLALAARRAPRSSRLALASVPAPDTASAAASLGPRWPARRQTREASHSPLARARSRNKEAGPVTDEPGREVGAGFWFGQLGGVG